MSIIVHYRSFALLRSSSLLLKYYHPRHLTKRSNMTVSYSVLKEQNASTSNAIMETFENNVLFQRLATYEGDATVARDDEDALKLEKGIRYAQQKGVLDGKLKPPTYEKIDVLGKTPTQVAEEILTQAYGADKKTKGGLIVLCGLSGTGKGTTVSMLRQLLEEKGEKVVTWSNGNIFRSVTLLASTWAEQNGLSTIDTDVVLTKDNLQDFMSMLSFDKFDGSNYDTRIHGLGFDNVLVSDIATTTLKSPAVSTNIPTVAEFTQGEVVTFASRAMQVLQESGYYVLLEGREQTVNYVPSPHRFTLVLSDESLIGKRRAAQRLMGAALKDLSSSGDDDIEDSKVFQTLEELVKQMVDEIDEEEAKKRNSLTNLFCISWFTRVLGFGGGSSK